MQIDVKSKMADPGFAGCIDLRYYIFECTQPGRDTQLYATIPMGAPRTLPLQCNPPTMGKLNGNMVTFKLDIYIK